MLIHSSEMRDAYGEQQVVPVATEATIQDSIHDPGFGSDFAMNSPI